METTVNGTVDNNEPFSLVNLHRGSFARREIEVSSARRQKRTIGTPSSHIRSDYQPVNYDDN